MRNLLFLALFSTLIFTACSDTAAPKQMKQRFQSVPETKAVIVQKGEHKADCAICGMHLASFYKTSHAATTKAGKKKQYCSLHCVVHDNELNKTDLTNLKVVDAHTLKFTSALSAYYVVGSSKPATMSKVSKYAFAKKSDAKNFSKKFGGKIVKFYDAYNIAIKDFTK